MKLLFMMFSFTIIGCSVIKTYKKVGECKREYDSEFKNYEIRQNLQTWAIGHKNDNTWLPLACKSELNSNFLDGTNNRILRKEGEAHTGRNAVFIFYPSLDLPKGLVFTINTKNIFGTNLVEVVLPEFGKVFLDKNYYVKVEYIINGMSINTFSEPSNPAKKRALQIFQTLSDLFPKRSQAISLQGDVKLVFARNSTEKFQDAFIRPNGHHDSDHLFAVFFSQDGTDVDEHLLHELAGLFRIPSNRYGHGLTWMVAYDQMEKSHNSLRRKCLELKRVISNLKNTAGTDFTNSIEFYVQDVHSRGGWPLYAWGSAFYWKKINRILVKKKMPSMYDLIDSMHTEKVLNEINDLDQLLLAYKKINPINFKTFDVLALKYFRQNNLGQLLEEALRAEVKLGCDSVN